MTVLAISHTTDYIAAAIDSIVLLPAKTYQSGDYRFSDKISQYDGRYFIFSGDETTRFAWSHLMNWWEYEKTASSFDDVEFIDNLTKAMNSTAEALSNCGNPPVYQSSNLYIISRTAVLKWTISQNQKRFFWRTERPAEIKVSSTELNYGGTVSFPTLNASPVLKFRARAMKPCSASNSRIGQLIG